MKEPSKYKIVVFDNRGIGRSSITTSPYGIGTLAEDVFALLSALQLDSYHLIGKIRKFC